MLSTEQLESIVGEDLNFLGFDTRLDYPPKARPSALTRLGARKPVEIWEKDSSRLELIFDCKYPSAGVRKILTKSVGFKVIFAQGFRNCRELFRHSPTQKGICSVLNAEPLDKVVNTDSSWMKAFQKYYKAASPTASLLPVFGSGIGMPIRIILDLHQR